MSQNKISYCLDLIRYTAFWLVGLSQICSLILITLNFNSNLPFLKRPNKRFSWNLGRTNQRAVSSSRSTGNTIFEMSPNGSQWTKSEESPTYNPMKSFPWHKSDPPSDEVWLSGEYRIPRRQSPVMA